MTEAEVEALIAAGVEESLTLDYKAADSLAKTDRKRAEITKDVSALANSAGGRIIYGVAEHRVHRHLPDRIDPIDSEQFPKEWLEQVIANIRPRIDGVQITPIRLAGSTDRAVYVVDVPQGTTAHQAADLKYYRRYNFESVPMYDHEIRDVMGRGDHPRVELIFHIERTIEVKRETSFPPISQKIVTNLVVMFENTGLRLARFAFGTCLMPVTLAERPHPMLVDKQGKRYLRIAIENTRRDILGFDGVESTPREGPSWYAPILPGLSRTVTRVPLVPNALKLPEESEPIWWHVHADNAPIREGSVRLGELRFIDRTGLRSQAR